MTIDRKTVMSLVAGVAIGYWLVGPAVNPPKPDRPVVRWIVRAAKNFLWFAAFAERPPEPQPDQRIVQAPAIGEDGYPLIDHGRGL